MDMPLNRGGVTVHRQQKLKRSGDLDFSGGDIAGACRALQRPFAGNSRNLDKKPWCQVPKTENALKFCSCSVANWIYQAALSYHQLSLPECGTRYLFFGQ